MITKERTISLAVIIAIAAIFVSSATIMSPTLAKSNNKEKTSSFAKDYKEFQKCLTNVAGSKGFASKVEIRDCFNPIFSPNSNQSNIESQGNNPSNMQSPQGNNPSNMQSPQGNNPSNMQSPQGNNPSNMQSPQGNNPSGIDFSSPQTTHH